jgi:hypothetical protein
VDESPAAVFDRIARVEMWSLSGRTRRRSGRERSLTEYDALLTAAGLRRISVTGARQSPQSVIEAVAI